MILFMSWRRGLRLFLFPVVSFHEQRTNAKTERKNHIKAKHKKFNYKIKFGSLFMSHFVSFGFEEAG